MDKKKTRYEKFFYRSEWMMYELTLSDKQRRIFTMAVMLYGCYGEFPEALRGKPLEYFQKNVMPDLDKQHSRLEKGKDLW